MRPEEFIETAERLLVEPCKEADKRSAISRAYYGAFHASRLSLPPSFSPSAKQTRSAGSHDAIVDRLILWGNAHAAGRTGTVAAAKCLVKLKRARKRADYKLDSEISPKDVKTCVRNSRRIVRLVRAARALFDKQLSSESN